MIATTTDASRLIIYLICVLITNITAFFHVSNNYKLFFICKGNLRIIKNGINVDAIFYYSCVFALLI